MPTIYPFSNLKSMIAIYETFRWTDCQTKSLSYNKETCSTAARSQRRSLIQTWTEKLLRQRSVFNLLSWTMGRTVLPNLALSVLLELPGHHLSLDFSKLLLTLSMLMSKCFWVHPRETVYSMYLIMCQKTTMMMICSIIGFKGFCDKNRVNR